MEIEQTTSSNVPFTGAASEPEEIDESSFSRQATPLQGLEHFSVYGRNIQNRIAMLLRQDSSIEEKHDAMESLHRAFTGSNSMIDEAVGDKQVLELLLKQVNYGIENEPNSRDGAYAQRIRFLACHLMSSLLRAGSRCKIRVPPLPDVVLNITQNIPTVILPEVSTTSTKQDEGSIKLQRKRHTNNQETKALNFKLTKLMRQMVFELNGTEYGITHSTNKSEPSGKLLEDHTQWNDPVESKRKMGVPKAMLWYPKAGRKLIEQAKAYRTWQRHKRKRKYLDEEGPVSEDLSSTQKPELVLPPIGQQRMSDSTKLITSQLKGDEAQDEHAHVLLRISTRLQRNLDSVLQGEGRLERGLFRSIDRASHGLPLRFRYEHSIDVEGCDRIVRRLLRRMVENFGVNQIRESWELWRSLVREQQMIRIVKMAGVGRLKGTVARMLQNRQARAFETWRNYSALVYREYKRRKRLRWLAKRNAAACDIQSFRRGLVVRRLYRIKLRRHYAARSIQTKFRMHVKRVNYLIVREAVINIQKNSRMWAVLKEIRILNGAALVIQRNLRMSLVIHAIEDLHYFVVRIQKFVRGCWGFRAAQRRLHEIDREEEYRWTCAIRIQRMVHIKFAGNRVRERKTVLEARDCAALKIQQLWYQYKEQFPAFFLMRALLLQDSVEEYEELLEERKMKGDAAIRIQQIHRGLASAKLAKLVRLSRRVAIALQRIIRGFIAKRRVQRFLPVWNSATKISKLARTWVRRRNSSARKIQRLWWNYKPGFLLKHLQIQSQSRQTVQKEWETLVQSLAAIWMQSLYRQWKSCKVLKNLRAAVSLTRVGRGFLDRKYVRRLWAEIRRRVATAAIEKPFHEAQLRAVYHIKKMRKHACLTIQCFARCCKANAVFRVKVSEFKLRFKAATTIQKLVRRVHAKLLLEKLRAREVRRKSNRYRRDNDIWRILGKAPSHARGYYCPFDPFAGIHPAEWLHMLGLQSRWRDLKLHKVNTVDKLFRCSDSLLQRVGVHQGSERKLIIDAKTASTLFSKVVLEVDKDTSKVRYRNVDDIKADSCVRLLEQLEHGAAIVFERMLSVSHLSVNFEQLFLEVYPGQVLRAKAFQSKLSEYPYVSSLQLEHFFDQFQGLPKQARDNIGKEFQLTCESPEVLQQWDRKRFSRCFSIYEMALERIRDLLPLDSAFQREVEILHDKTLRKAIHQTRRGCNLLRAMLEQVRLQWVGALVLQRWFRGYRARERFRQLRTNKLLLTLHRVYKEEMTGGLVRSRHHADLEAEREAYRQYMEALRRDAIKLELQGVMRYGWESRYDTYYDAYYFEKVIDPDVGDSAWEMPLYTEDEREAGVKIQTAMRVKLGKNTVKRMKIAIEKLRLKNFERDQWLAKAHERHNHVTLRIAIGMLDEKEVDTATLPGDLYSWQANWENSISNLEKEEDETVAEEQKERDTVRTSSRNSSRPSSSASKRPTSKQRAKRPKQHSKRVPLKRGRGTFTGTAKEPKLVSRSVNSIVAKRKQHYQELVEKLAQVKQKIEAIDAEIDSIHQQQDAVKQIQLGKKVNVAWVKYMSKPLPTPGIKRIPDSELRISNLCNTEVDCMWKLVHTTDGVPYYYHKESMETRWDMPAEMEEARHKIEVASQRQERKQMLQCDKRIVTQEFELSRMFDEELETRMYLRKHEARTSLDHLYSMGYRLPHHSEEFVSRQLESEHESALKLCRVARGFLARKTLNLAKLAKAKYLLEAEVGGREMEVKAAKDTMEAAYVTVNVAFDPTWVDVPWGWSIVADGYGRQYYYHGLTGETSWARPEYSWDEEFSCRTIQRIVRGFLGRARFKHYVTSFKVSDMIQAGLKGYQTKGCFGCGCEGVSAEMWFARMGLHFLLPPVRSKSIANRNRRKLVERFMPWTAQTLAEIGFLPEKTEKEGKAGMDETGFGDHDSDYIYGINQALEILKNAEKFLEKDVRLQGRALELITDMSFASDAFRKMFPSQTARAEKFAVELSNSPTPYTYAQVVRHIFKYRGKASFAINQIRTEIAMKPVISGKKELHMLYYAMRAPLVRLSVVVGNMQLPTLRGRLKEILRLADELNEASKLRDKLAEASSPGAGPKSPKQSPGNTLKTNNQQSKTRTSATHDLKSKRLTASVPITLLQDRAEISIWNRTIFKRWASSHDIESPGACFALRQGFQHLLEWEAAATRIQEKYRSTLALRQWRLAVQQWHLAALHIECFWRVCSAVRATATLRAQFQSPWHEYWDEEHGRNFFHNNETGEAQWHRPQGEPYRPLGWWPPDESQIPVPPGMCFVCRVSEARLVCQQCFVDAPAYATNPDGEPPQGVPKRFCFSCYAEQHDKSRELALHRHVRVGSADDAPMGCVLCQFEARRRCLECEDNYCLACYRRVHGKGSRRQHHWLAFRSGALACSECEQLLATKRCLRCRDVYCNECFEVMHRKGRRKGHTFEEIVEEVKEGQGR